jgi:hypothetical protein
MDSMLFARKPIPLAIAVAVSVAMCGALFAACSSGDDEPERTPIGQNSTPTVRPTEPPPPTFDPRTSTPSPADFIGTITMDTNPDTTALEHDTVTAATGATFRIGIAVHDVPEPYRGYQVALGWDDNGTLSFVSEAAIKPENMNVCSDVQPLLDGTLNKGRIGVYGGCLSQEAGITFTGLVTVLTFSCDKAGRIGLRTLSVNESMSLGTSLIAEHGQTIGEEVDNGIEVVCT